MMRVPLLLCLLGLAAPAAGAPADGAPVVAEARKRKPRKKAKKKPAPKPEEAKPAPQRAPEAKDAAATGPSLQRSTRIEFDARLVRGEKASGAVYLFQRAPRRFPPLVDLRRSYLERVVRPVLQRAPDEKKEE